MTRRYAIIEAPSVLGVAPSGIEDLPDALLGASLATRLQARRAGRVEPPPYDGRRDPETLMLNPHGIAAYARMLADAIGSVLDRGEFPVVLGGDCSILLGPMLALKRRGRYGLLFLDGHADFYQPEAEPKGEAASMDLALATGRGPEVVTRLEGCWPLVRDEDIAVLGFRDRDEAASYGSQPLPTSIMTIDLAEARRMGVEAAARRAVGHVARDELQGFWIHLDVDVLDDVVMPAVDYRMPDGFSWEEFRIVLFSALGSRRAVGMEVTIFNPRLDPDGSLARALVVSLFDALPG